jgi:hypothetical protein
MAPPQAKLKCQAKVIVDNQQVNVVANEKEIEVEQIIIIYTPIVSLFIILSSFLRIIFWFDFGCCSYRGFGGFT